ILLANVQYLENKLDDLSARVKFQRDIQDCNLLCFTKTWLSPAVPDHAIQLAEFFSVHRMDRTMESGKTRGGGVCLMADMDTALWELHEALTLHQTQHRDAALIVAGDFNSANLKPVGHVLDRPINGCSTRHSDADWDMFRRSSDDVNVIMEVVVGFIGKLVDDTVHKTIIRKFPNQKPWVDKTVHDALRSHSAAYNSGLASGNMDEYKAASYSVRRVFKEVKWCYGKILESQFHQSGSRSLWQGLRTITVY
ncbi:hypothetical protein QTP70_024467, partial [Hemibagrus guttatus]